MNEKSLLKISLITAILGLMILFVISENIEIPEISVDELEEYVDKEIKLNGEVLSYRDFGKTAILKVAQPTAVDVFLFKNRNISIEKGDYVSVTGEAKKYLDDFEIVAAKIDIS